MAALGTEFRRKKTTILEILRIACMCGAAEERGHCLNVIWDCREIPLAIKRELSAVICSKSVLDVLGYESRESEVAK